ncbi:MAG: hypothetical protein HZA50_09565 [Planctomycetes bacterium]|nr:hypothetical protein [Planctomycetota bacterium]
MGISIVVRTVLCMVLLAAGVGVAVGYLASRAAQSQIERRLVEDVAANTARVIAQQKYPLTDDYCCKISQLVGAEVVLSAEDRKRLQASSMSVSQSDEFLKAIGRPGDLPTGVVIEDKPFRVAAAPIFNSSGGPSGRPAYRLFVLVAQAKVDEARNRIASSIWIITLGAVLAAAVVGLVISVTMSYPIRKLARRIHAISVSAGQAQGLRGIWTGIRHGPPEVVRLARAFDELLTRLDTARTQLALSARLAAIGQLTATVAHELRNPLSGMKMNAKVLADELAKRGLADQSLDFILREIDRMDQQLTNMLGLSGGSAGPQNAPPDKKPARLAALADSVLDLLAPRCKAAKVRIEKSYDPHLPDIPLDAEQIRQVILNLAINALDAMAAGGILTVVARKAAAAARFEIKDTGAGVNEASRDKVFEPFVTTKPGGTGLGLHISRRIILSHGGKMDFASSPAGCIFWFELPLA